MPCDSVIYTDKDKKLYDIGNLITCGERKNSIEFSHIEIPNIDLWRDDRIIELSWQKHKTEFEIDGFKINLEAKDNNAYKLKIGDKEINIYIDNDAYITEATLGYLINSCLSSIKNGQKLCNQAFVTKIEGYSGDYTIDERIRVNKEDEDEQMACTLSHEQGHHNDHLEATSIFSDFRAEEFLEDLGLEDKEINSENFDEVQKSIVFDERLPHHLNRENIKDYQNLMGKSYYATNICEFIAEMDCLLNENCERFIYDKEKDMVTCLYELYTDTQGEVKYFDDYNSKSLLDMYKLYRFLKGKNGIKIKTKE